MNVTLKSVKFFAAMTEETHCFTATVYVDGKKMFGVKNAGHGGENEYFHVNGGVKRVYDTYHTLNAEFAKTKLAPPFECLNDSLDSHIGHFMNQWLVDREIKKNLRKITYMVGSVMYEVKAKPTVANIERVKKQSWWKPDNIILNNLPIEDVRQYFTEEHI